MKIPSDEYYDFCSKVHNDLIKWTEKRNHVKLNKFLSICRYFKNITLWLCAVGGFVLSIINLVSS